jgi:peptide/nickel transport system ATP-binding protein/oligopeptide transport system ATP-binding protein
MYAGRVVESGPASALFRHPRHAYTAALLGAVPAGEAGTRLATIPGAPPDPRAMPAGCAFRPRCGWALPECARAQPMPRAIAPEHLSSCLAADQLPARA